MEIKLGNGADRKVIIWQNKYITCIVVMNGKSIPA